MAKFTELGESDLSAVAGGEGDDTFDSLPAPSGPPEGPAMGVGVLIAPAE